MKTCEREEVGNGSPLFIFYSYPYLLYSNPLSQSSKKKKGGGNPPALVNLYIVPIGSGYAVALINQLMSYLSYLDPLAYPGGS